VDKLDISVAEGVATPTWKNDASCVRSRKSRQDAEEGSSGHSAVAAVQQDQEEYAEPTAHGGLDLAHDGPESTEAQERACCSVCSQFHDT
jgi:hypothetical protein